MDPVGVILPFLEDHLQELLRHLLRSHLPVGGVLAHGVARCPISMVHVLNLMISFGVAWRFFFQDALNVTTFFSQVNGKTSAVTAVFQI